MYSLATFLAKDLRAEFYPYFPQFMRVLTDLLRAGTDDARLIEAVFHGIGFLFKYLRKELTHDVRKTLDLMRPMLADRHKYIRWFSGPSIAFLFRKLPMDAMENVIKYTFHSVVTNEGEEYCEGIAISLYETMKGPRTAFHSRMPKTLGLVLSQLFDLTNNRVLDVIRKMLTLMLIHADDAGSAQVASCLLDFTKKTIDTPAEHAIMNAFELLQILASIRNGSRLIASLHQMMDFCASACSRMLEESWNVDVATRFLTFFAAVICRSDVDAAIRSCKYVEDILNWNFRLGLFLSDLILSLKWNRATIFLLPSLIRCVEKQRETENFDAFLAFLAKHIGQKTLDLTEVTPVSTETGRIRIKSKHIENYLRDMVSMKPMKVLTEMTEFSGFEADPAQLSCMKLTLFLKCIPYLKFESEDMQTVLLDSIRALLDLVESVEVGSPTNPTLFTPSVDQQYLTLVLLSQYLQVITDCAQMSNFLDNILSIAPAVFNLVPSHGKQHRIFLDASQQVLTLASQDSTLCVLFNTSALEKALPVLSSNLQSPVKSVRLNTLLILNLFDQLNWQHADGSGKRCNIFQLMIDVERTPDTPAHIREKLTILRKISNACVQYNRLPELYSATIPRFCCGLLTVNFQPLWKDAMELIMSFGRGNNKNLVWAIWWENASIYSAEDSWAALPHIHGLSSAASELIQGRVSRNLSVAQEKISSVGVAVEMFSDSGVDQLASLGSLCKEELEAPGKCESIIAFADAFQFEEQRTFRFDGRNYCSLLFRAMETHGIQLAEQHAKKTLVPMMIDLYRVGFESNGEETVVDLHRRLHSFLSMFSKFRSPEVSLGKEVSEQLISIYNSLLMSNDTKLQHGALACLVTHKSLQLTAHGEMLNALIEDKTFRDTLSCMSLDEGGIPPSQRPHLIPVVTRLLFGKMAAKKSTDLNKLALKRTAILNFIATYNRDELEFFVNLLMAPFSAVRKLIRFESGKLAVPEYMEPSFEGIDTRTLIGFLHRVGDIIKQIGGYLNPFMDELFGLIVYINIYAARRIDSLMDIDDLESKRIREVRSLGLKRVVQVFKLKSNPLFTCDLSKFVGQLFGGFVSSRLALFDSENTQAPSALFDLFTCWTAYSEYVEFLTEYDERVLPKVFSCLASSNVKPSVVGRVLEITENLLTLTNSEGAYVGRVAVARHAKSLIDNLQTLLERTPSLTTDQTQLGKDLLTRKTIWILSEMTCFAQNDNQLQSLTDLLIPFLHKPDKLVPEVTKRDILVLLSAAIPILPSLTLQESIFSSTYYGSLCRLFASLQTRAARDVLLEAFGKFQSHEPYLARVWALIVDLNSYSTVRLDEPDWNRRMDAVNNISESLVDSLTSQEWRVLLYNFLFLMNDPEEQVIRSSASQSLVEFVKRSARSKDQDLYGLMVHIVFSAIKKAMRSTHEVVRAEFVNVLSTIVSSFPEDPAFNEMRCLCASGDDEASFFHNIYHVQHHRRSRALRRFADIVERGEIRPGLLNSIFLPMISHVLFETDRILDQQMVTDAITAIGAIAGKLPWNQYYALLRQYFRVMPLKPQLTKPLIRVVVAILDHFHWDICNVDVVEVKDHEEDEMGHEEESEQKTKTNRIQVTVVDKILPDLYTYLNDRKDGEANMTVRVPIAIAYAKLLIQLPKETIELELPRLLTNVSQVLRSRSQEVRDVARDTIIQIAELLGAKYFMFVVKELSGALQKGYQVHILGYSLHALLAVVVPRFLPGELDHCIPLIVPILLNDIFGLTGEEKEVEQIASKMKESRARKSFDSFELVSQIITLNAIDKVLRPIRDIMVETSGASITRNIEEIFNRIAVGLMANESYSAVDFTLFAFKLMAGEGKLFEIGSLATSTREKDTDNYAKNFTVQTFARTEKQIEIANHFRENSHLLTELGFSLLYFALKKSRYDPSNEEHINLLDPLVIVLKDALGSRNSSVLKSALYSLTALTRFPLPANKIYLPMALEKCFKILRGTTSTSDELVQSCFKLMAVVIREPGLGKVTDNHLVFLINLIRPDLEIPEKQSTTFSLVKAILARKIMVPEMYDMIDDLSRVMVTNQTDQIRDLCRACLLQFMLTYPLGTKRLQKHINFIVTNLEYSFESGRLSVMEYMNSMVIRYPDSVINEYGQLMFLALVLRVINDPAVKCREMAAVLAGRLLGRVGGDEFVSLTRIFSKWLDASQTVEWKQAGVQVVGVLAHSLDYFSVDRQSTVMSSVIPDLLVTITGVLEQYLPEKDEDDDYLELDVSQTKLLHQIIETLTKIFVAAPDVIRNGPHQIWSLVDQCMTYPNMGVREACCSFYTNILSSDLMKQRRITYLAETSSLNRLATSFCIQLKNNQIARHHGMTIIKALCLLAPHLTTAIELQVAKEESDMEEDEMTTRQVVPLLQLVKRLSVMARRDLQSPSETMRRSFIFKFFAYLMLTDDSRLASVKEEDVVSEYLMAILAPVYRTTLIESPKPHFTNKFSRRQDKEDESVSPMETSEDGLADTPEQLKHQCTSLMAELESKFPKLYLTVLARIVQHVSEKRQERRQKTKMLAVANPEASARRKIKKNLNKRESRKRKMDEVMKFKKGTSMKREKRVRLSDE